MDTRRATVAEAAIQAGANMINDVSGGRADPSMLSTVARLGVPIILMHMRGTPQTMTSPEFCTYGSGASVVEEVAVELQESLQAADDIGIPR